MAIIMKQTERDMSFGQIGRQGQRLFGQNACTCQLGFTQRVSQPMTPQAANSQLGDRQGEIGVARDCVLVPGFRLYERFRPEVAVRDSVFELAFEEKIISLRVFRRRARQGVGFGWRKFGFQ